MKVKQTIMLCALAGAALAAGPERTLEDGIYAFNAGTNVYYSGTWDLVRISTNNAPRMVAPRPPNPQPKPGE